MPQGDQGCFFRQTNPLLAAGQASWPGHLLGLGPRRPTQGRGGCHPHPLLPLPLPVVLLLHQPQAAGGQPGHRGLVGAVSVFVAGAVGLGAASSQGPAPWAAATGGHNQSKW